MVTTDKYMNGIKYVHDEVHHNINAPSIIIPFLIENIQPKSVIDVGCGVGTFLSVFKSHAVDDIFGLDGEWVNMELLKKHIDLSYFKTANLEAKIDINRKFDLAISLEVAEHIKESSADVFVENLINLSNIIVFSAAFPGQGGQNHVNEQWPSYWADKFEKHNYKFYDVLRPYFWDNQSIDIWYRQNMFLVVKNGHNDIIPSFNMHLSGKIMNIIHPEIFKNQLVIGEKLAALQKNHDDYIKGRNNLVMYLKVIVKYFLRKIHLYNK